MKALSVLYGGRLGSEAFQTVSADSSAGMSSFSLAFAAASRFPGTQKVVFLAAEGKEYPGLPSGIETIFKSSWTPKNLLEELSVLARGFDFLYFSWADCPFLDPALASSLADRHIRYAAEYSYADGWPYGIAPELLSVAAAPILAKMAGDGPVERDTLFEIIKKDINSFDIETEISPSDLRQYRLSLCADSKRNLILLRRFIEAGFSSACDAERIITEKPELLRTLPAFYSIQVSGACPQACSLCPWPVYGGGEGPVSTRKDFMPSSAFALLLDKIIEFSGDAVIDLSLWGELSLHGEKMELIQMVLDRPPLSLVAETSGIGWKNEELEALAAAAAAAAPRENRMAPLSWIVSLDACDPERYKEVRGAGFSEARSCARKLLSLFPDDAYVQAVRVKGYEDDIEHFYRFWKEEGLNSGLSGTGNYPLAGMKTEGNGAGSGGKSGRRSESSHIIIQKYDDFAGALPKLQATDLSPVKRKPCWHIMRDMYILLDGRVPACREDLACLKGMPCMPLWGNALGEEFSVIWERGLALYKEHCKGEYKEICGNCDEWYTYNF